MTKKDYELIAGVVHRLNTGIIYGVERWTEELAHDLQVENPRFDREKFLRACGVKCECYDEKHTEQEIKHCICDCHINEQWFSESIKTAGDSKENWEKHIQGLRDRNIGTELR